MATLKAAENFVNLTAGGFVTTVNTTFNDIQNTPSTAMLVGDTAHTLTGLTKAMKIAAATAARYGVFTIASHVDHYHRERHHQGIGRATIDPGPEVNLSEGRLVCRKRLGGLLNYYYREAA